MMTLEFSFHFNDTVSTAQVFNVIMFKINVRKEDTLQVAQQCSDNWGIFRRQWVLSSSRESTESANI